MTITTAAASSPGLLSFRRNAARIARDGKKRSSVGRRVGKKGRGANYDDDDDDGWVHGGRYVPPPPPSSRPTPTPTPRPPKTSSAATPAPRPGTGRTAMSATRSNRLPQPSPYSMLSPPPLGEPLPTEEPTTSDGSGGGATGGASRTPQTGDATGGASRTPQTAQLRRLLRPTPARAATPAPAAATPARAAGAVVDAVAVVAATPTTASAAEAATPPQTPAGVFLLRSGVPTAASRALGDALHRAFLSTAALETAVRNACAYLWDAAPEGLVHDVADSLLELIAEFFNFFVRLAKLVAPFVLWTLQTVIALFMTIAGTVPWAAMLLAGRSRRDADGSAVGSARRSAIKSLEEAVRNSPFLRKRRDGGVVPFTGFTDAFRGASLSPATHEGERRVDRIGDGNVGGGGRHHPVLASSLASSSDSVAIERRRQTTKATNGAADCGSTPPPDGVVVSATSGRNSSLRHTPGPDRAVPAAATTPATARRVLFSTTVHGEVSTEQFHYDKNLPASARKVVGHRQRRGGVVDDDDDDDDGVGQRPASGRARAPTPPSAAPDPGAAPSPAENKILRPSRYFEGAADSPDEGAARPGPNVAAVAEARPAAASSGTTSKPLPLSAAANAGSNLGEKQFTSEEEQKQQYIKRYGLLPTITPLSKRYGRMKRQQQEGGQHLPPGAAGPGGGNVKRRRRGDLLGAASRLGRTRRARLGNGGGGLPSVVLNRGRTPTKRPRDDARDEWVWRAMNHDGQKENRENEPQGGLAKRGKFGAAVNGDGGGGGGVSTPPKNNLAASSLPSLSTPPRTPGLSKLGGPGSATPAPKKMSAGTSAGVTPGKPTIAAFSFRDGGKVGDPSTDAGGSTAGGFSFGAKNSDNAVGAASGTSTFSFGATPAPAAVEKKDAPAAASVPGFSFNASSATASTAQSGTEKKDAATASSAVPVNSFGSNPKSESAAAAASAPFTFGGSKPTGGTTSSAPGVDAFSFGTNTSVAGGTVAAPAPAQPSFGALSQPASMSTTLPKEAPAPLGASFSFGAAPTAGGGTSAPPTNTAPALAPFKFGASSQPTPATASGGGAFSFGATATGGTPGVAQPKALAFGAGASSGAATPAVPNFGATPAATGFNLGGGLSSAGGGTSGASARRRAAKASGRRR